MATRVLIAGGGPAGLEAALAIRALAGDRVDLTLLALDPVLVQRPAAVGEPFGLGAPRRYPVASIAARAGAELRIDRLRSIEPERHAATTEAGARLRYDVLVVAVGAVPVVAYPKALTFGGPEQVAVVERLLASADAGYVVRLAFVVPGGPVWPLPLYELALLCAGRARDRGLRPDLHLVTPEPVPLAGLGDRAAALVSDGLREAGIALHADELAEVPDPHLVTLPRERAALDVDRVLASPVLRGRKIEGLPADADGFVPVDRHGRVTGAPDVFAAGDITAGPLKYGAFGTQQAEAVARAVAFRAGADVERIPYAPAAAGALLTAAGPRALDAVAMNDEPAWPDAKRSGHRLGPCLEAIDAARAAGSPQALA